MTRAMWAVCFGLMGVAGCGGSSSTTPGNDGGTSSDTGATADSSGDSGSTDDTLLLIEGSWTLAPMEEDYQCIRVTVPTAMYIHEFIPVIPEGTHHTVLTYSPSGPDGQSSCDGFTNGPRMIYGSGVGTEALELPPGIAVYVPAGQQILLNLHLFNSSASPISGTSAIRVRTLEQSEVTDMAEVVLAGKDEGLYIPPHATTTETGQCTFQAESTVFAVFPHMHQTATHMRLTARPSGGAEQVLMDDDYDFDQQRYQNVGPLLMPVGSQLIVDCTYDNPTSSPITFGESSNDEMCYAGVYRYPARLAAGYFTCTL